MPAKTPFLLSLDDMDALGVYFNNLTNTLITPQGNRTSGTTLRPFLSLMGHFSAAVSH